ncbi:PhoH family protein [Cerasicoccus arenae]|uniref:PhoH-like protein n=1 Tax=Cerasicoccus arenae TaxID=424488 RepID=A0A8J3GD56_9BACT|nr:PhoH family protein [Cerasicoccus arenae]MBK1858979.1 PhoH family protein [Cerasicoccus arenae]GHC04213.1 phosphate starvation protein PhoH [Cerasicoccus arenae]
MATEKLQFPSPRHLSSLYCAKNDNLSWAEKVFDVNIVTREAWLDLEGAEKSVVAAVDFFNTLDAARNQGINLTNNDFSHILEAFERGEGQDVMEVFNDPLVIRLRKASIIPKTINQKRYLQFIQKNDVVFGIGPAGTGKTYLAMAAALYALQEGEVKRIIITRPAVEAGEALGFLPGELEQKLDPYLRPIYDAMYDMMGKEDSAKMREKGLIEIAPLAYMRGRTLSHAYVILDEAQNTTHEQMMMFLTRLGEGSKMIVTGDITQVDLPRSKMSGLKQAVQILANIKGIKLFYFDAMDVVRHPLVSRIIQAYEKCNLEKQNDRR